MGGEDKGYCKGVVAYGDKLNISTTLSPLKEDELVPMPNLPRLMAICRICRD